MFVKGRLRAWLGQARARRFWLGDVGAVTLLNGCVAVLAFGKDLLTASYFGTSFQADALTLAYFVPDTIGNSVLAAAVGVACVPVFARYASAQDWPALRRSTIVSLAVFSMLAVALTAVLYMESGNVAAMLAGSGNSELGRRVLELLRVLLPLIVPYPAIMIGSALLQAIRRFTLPAAVPLIPHTTVIAALGLCLAVSAAKDTAASVVASAMLAGSVVMAAFTWAGALRSGVMRRCTRTAETEAPALSAGLREIGKVFVPFMLILCTMQSVYVVERMLASRFEEGTVAGLNYAFRLAQFPILVFVAAISAVVLPSLSQDLAIGRADRLQRKLGRAFTDILIVAVPTTLLFFLLREPIVAALFQRGAFTADSVKITSDLLAGYALTIAPLALSAVGLRYFLAAGRVGLPLAVSVLSAAINIAADYAFAARLGAAGLGYGAALGSAANAAMLLALLARELNYNRRTAVRALAAVAAANFLPLVMLIVISMATSRLEWLRQAGGLLHDFARIGFVGAAIIFVGGVYAVCLVKFKLLGRKSD
ncbi:hypothetical protein SD70_28575 [Gordoniibacillus kamchatkensis]|uniref:Lipid II flippase MurJ n=1 Tax=Gordoniibacillus kamchatkensis TaxID=1590651 RepID=A0ABR5AB92_9BACL|nr:lipid II flippase MurJ [Paenibacillus sp. VKM B-2647]KIL38108.1 hypothetical protein SD70_28575 [Paenibacillus sp. VKM B-2647]